MYINQLQENYVNPLLYPVSVINFTCPGRVVIYILIGELTSKSALLLLTLLSVRKPHFKKRPVIVNPIKCKQKIHGVLLVILHSKRKGWVIDIDFIIICGILNNKRYIFCYFIMNYDENLIFNLLFLYVIYHHFSQKLRIIALLSFLLQFSKSVKELHKV